MNYNFILLSSEFFNFLIFSLCVNKIIVKDIKRNKLIKNFFNIIEQIRTINAPIIEDREEYLKKKAISNQEAANKIPKGRDIAKIIPKYTATPFPPLNFNQIGNICAIKQINAEKINKSLKYIKEIITELYPFKISNISVAIAKDFFPVLRTFVVPIFPDPIFRISCFKKILVNIKPKGIEPSK
jgi:hypothetical protein